MRKIFIIAISFFLSIEANFSQDIRIISKPELVEILNNTSDKLHVINFWASWCGPCVKELPEFQAVVTDSDTSKIDFLFISLDFPSELETKLKPFVRDNKLAYDIVLMNDIDYNSWIDLVDPAWQGNIPATLFFNNKQGIHQFISKPVDNEIIVKTINTLFNN